MTILMAALNLSSRVMSIYPCDKENSNRFTILSKHKQLKMGFVENQRLSVFGCI